MQDAAVPTQVKGRLKKRVGFWRGEMKASAFLLDVIEHGCVLPQGLPLL